MADELDLTMVIMRFDAVDRPALEAVLANYVVSSRGHPGCLNIDLSGSIAHPGRYVIVEKWGSPDAQRAHFDSDDMVKLAEACKELLAGPPDIDLLAPVSAHDLW
jgi:quinol monooxygenase YgiN